MKIYFLIADLGAGGQERQLTYLLDGLNRKGHELKVITWNPSENGFYSQTIINMGIDIVSTDNSLPGKIKSLRSIVRSEKPDVLQSFSFYLNIYTYIACLFTGTKAWGAIRSSMALYRSETPRSMYLLSSFFPFRFISNNHSFSKQMPAWRRRMMEKNTKVIANAISTLEFEHKHNEDSDTKRVHMVSVGRVSAEKRIDLIIKAHKKLREEGHNIVHTHAGSGPDLEELKSMAESLGVNESFKFIGILSKVADLLLEADIFVHSSDFEGSPNAVMEAVAMGLPVISTNCGDVPFIVDEGKGGFVVATGDWQNIAEKASYLIKNPNLRKEMSSYNLSISRERFSIEKQVEKYLEAYNSAN